MGNKEDEAFQMARDAIKLAKQDGWVVLELNAPEFKSLVSLPAEVAELDALEILDLADTKIRNIDLLSHLTGLTDLVLRGTSVEDLSALSGLKNLSTLYLGDTPVFNLSAISNLHRIAQLSIWETKITDISTVSNFKALEYLSMWNTSVSDISALSDLTNLKTLKLGSTLVNDLSPISRLLQIVDLDLSETPVTSLSPISQLSEMVSLDLSSTQISDISALSKMKKLEFLDLSEMPVGIEQIAATLRGKPRLIPSDTPTTSLEDRGVKFSGCAAAKEDPILGRIAEMEDSRERTSQLFEYLGIKSTEVQQAQSLKIPTRRPAPLEVEITDTAIVFAGSQGLPSSDASTRAEMGWEALKEYRDNFANGFAIHNYQPLPRRLEDFDRAMGDRYDPRNVVRIWSQGQRIQQLARDPEFLAMLPVGVPDDLKGFAAAISLYAERFPDVIAYRDDVSPDDRSPANVRAGEAEFKAIEAVLSQMPEAELVVKEEYRAEVEAGTSTTADAEASKAIVVSTGELMRETAEKAQQKRNRKLARMGGEVVEDFIVKPLGLPYHFAKKVEVPMRALAKRFPNRMGWVDNWYDLTFGRDEDQPDDGAL